MLSRVDSLKLTSLHDYYQRLLHGSQPVPSGLDMANTVKFFSQMLLCKNENNIIQYYFSNHCYGSSFCNFQLCWKKFAKLLSKWSKLRNSTQNAWLFIQTWITSSCTTPSLSWSTLSPPFILVCKVWLVFFLCDDWLTLPFHFKRFKRRLKFVTNNYYYVPAFGQALLQCLASLLPFLDHDLIDNVSYLTASSISVLPVELHQDIVNNLCFYILPFTISRCSSFSDWLNEYSSVWKFGGISFSFLL